MSLKWLIGMLGFVNGWYTEDIKLPYDTEIKQWEFLDQEPEIVLADVIATEPTDPYDIIYELMERVLGGNQLLDQFKLELIEVDDDNRQELSPLFLPKSRADHPFWSKLSTQSLDVIELDNDANNIILRGTSTIALAVAFNWYLQDICNTTYGIYIYIIYIYIISIIEILTSQ